MFRMTSAFENPDIDAQEVALSKSGVAVLVDGNYCQEMELDICPYAHGEAELSPIVLLYFFFT